MPDGSLVYLSSYMSGNDKAGPSRRRPPLQDNGSGQFACGDKVDERELEQVGFRDLPLRPQVSYFQHYLGLELTFH